MRQEMEYIYMVYKEKSISKAAKKLYVSQPALSMAIKRVEKELNDSIFDRNCSPLQLTEVGRIYIEKYIEMKSLERDLEKQIADIHGLKKGELRVAGNQFNLSLVFAPVLVLFSDLYPNITLTLKECNTETATRMLTEGEIDLCLCCNTDFPNIKVVDEVFCDELMVAIPKHFINKFKLPKKYLTLDEARNGEYKKAIDFKLISHIPFTIPLKTNSLHQILSRLFEDSNVNPDIKMEVDQLATSFYLAEDGLGATLVSTQMIKKFNSDNLAFYHIDSPFMQRNFKAVVSEKGYVSQATVKFINLLKNHYAHTYDKRYSIN